MNRSEQGFSLIELMVSISIVGILAALSMTSFWVYKENAEYAKAESTLRNAQTAFEIGDQESAPGSSMPLTYTADTGGPTVGVLGDMLPSMVTPEYVRLGALHNHCDSNSPPGQINKFLQSIPCRGSNQVTWTSFCNGLDIRLENIPSPGC